VVCDKWVVEPPEDPADKNLAKCSLGVIPQSQAFSANTSKRPNNGTQWACRELMPFLGLCRRPSDGPILARAHQQS